MSFHGRGAAAACPAGKKLHRLESFGETRSERAVRRDQLFQIAAEQIVFKTLQNDSDPLLQR